MKVVILCGGLGTRLREETEYRPKPMVPVGGRPILWHIMNRYAAYGFKDFILCLGYKGDMIKDYFLHYRTRTSDFTLTLGTDGNQAIRYHSPYHERDWSITFVETGEQVMTGARVKRVESHIDGPEFMLTYGDGLADVNLQALLDFHRRHGRLGTLTSVQPGVGRFGELDLEGSQITRFVEKPQQHDAYINGGFFVFKREFLRSLSDEEGCVLEQEPLQTLAQQGQLMAYRHAGYWQCMDTYRDAQQLNDIWNRGQAPWTIVQPAKKPGRSSARRLKAAHE